MSIVDNGDNTLTVLSNNIPDHSAHSGGTPQSIIPQINAYTIPKNPVEFHGEVPNDENPAYGTQLGAIGVAVNGVAIYRKFAEIF